MGPKPKPLADRFKGKWIVDPDSGCWLWTGATIGGKYGAIKEDRQKLGAHIASWRLHKGEVPTGMLVCHHCDTPLCVNPDHLFLATHQENVSDCVSKKRHAFGERNSWSKLKQVHVDFIRSSAFSIASLANLLGVSTKTIRRVRAGETWKLVT